METRNITFEGLEMEIVGTWEDPEENYKGGWSTYSVMVNDVDIIWILNEKTIERINEIIIEIL